MNTKSNAYGYEVTHSENVRGIREHMPKKQTMRELSDLYKMFSDLTRIQILWALECNELCVCDLAELLNINMSAISHQLRVLRLAKLVVSRRDGKNIYYSLPDHVKDILLHGLGHVNNKRLQLQ